MEDYFVDSLLNQTSLLMYDQEINGFEALKQPTRDVPNEPIGSIVNEASFSTQHSSINRFEVPTNAVYNNEYQNTSNNFGISIDTLLNTIVVPKKTYVCSVCFVDFEDASLLIAHQSVHEKERNNEIEKSKIELQQRHQVNQELLETRQELSKLSGFVKKIAVVVNEVQKKNYKKRERKSKKDKNKKKSKKSRTEVIDLANNNNETNKSDMKNRCQVCGKKCKNSKTLAQHRFDVHPTVWFNCKHCNQKFPSKRNYKRHEDACLTMKKVKCFICNELMTPALLPQHKKDKHNILLGFDL